MSDILDYATWVSILATCLTATLNLWLPLLLALVAVCLHGLALTMREGR